MICPNCGNDNLPGCEECSRCQQDLTQLDRPAAQDRIERSLMEDPVAILSPNKAITVSPTATVANVLQIMLKEKIGSLLIVGNDGKLLGIFSERDLLTKVAGLNEPFENLTVSQYMTAAPETVTAQDKLAFALHKMDIGGYRHMPIVDEGRPTGIISVRDVLRHITRLCSEF